MCPDGAHKTRTALTEDGREMGRVRGTDGEAKLVVGDLLKVLVVVCFGVRSVAGVVGVDAQRSSVDEGERLVGGRAVSEMGEGGGPGGGREGAVGAVCHGRTDGGAEGIHGDLRVLGADVRGRTWTGRSRRGPGEDGTRAGLLATADL